MLPPLPQRPELLRLGLRRAGHGMARSNPRMDALTIGADAATMATGLSVLTATVVWTRRQYREWRDSRRERQRRGWQDCINPHGISTRDVRLVVDPDEPTALVVLEVPDSEGGKPADQRAQSMRQTILADQLLSQSPSPDQHDFIVRQWSAASAIEAFVPRQAKITPGRASNVPARGEDDH